MASEVLLAGRFCVLCGFESIHSSSRAVLNLCKLQSKSLKSCCRRKDDRGTGLLERPLWGGGWGVVQEERIGWGLE